MSAYIAKHDTTKKIARAVDKFIDVMKSLSITGIVLSIVCLDLAIFLTYIFFTGGIFNQFEESESWEEKTFAITFITFFSLVVIYIILNITGHSYWIDNKLGRKKSAFGKRCYRR